MMSMSVSPVAGLDNIGCYFRSTRLIKLTRGIFCGGRGKEQEDSTDHILHVAEIIWRETVFLLDFNKI